MSELVSIIMLTYNHARWVEKAIRSILAQETQYSFKLYINDDASTDGTQDIIRKLESEYPDLICCTYQKENQYSQGVNICRTFLYPMVHGEYIAFCEGDDYWIDTKKLQKQIDYMEKHDECTFCFSNASIVDIDGNPIRKFYSKYSWNDRTIIKKLKDTNGADFDVDEMLLLDFTPTASTVFRYDTLAELFNYQNSLDLLTRLVATNMGYAHYHNEIFTAYRVGNEQSASGSIQHSYEKLKKKFYDLHVTILKEFNSRTKQKYSKTIEHVIKRKEITLYLASGKEYLSRVWTIDCWNELPTKRKINLIIKYFIYRFGF